MGAQADLANKTRFRNSLGVSSQILPNVFVLSEDSATPLVSNAQGGIVLMSDDSGRLKGMIWETEHDTEGNTTVQVNKLDLGTASPASSLTYLGSGHIFLSSACADSQLLKLMLPTTIPPGSPVSPKSSPRSPISRKGKGRANHEDVSSRSITVGKTATGSTEVLERWMNLAPVKDFAVVSDESGGTVRTHTWRVVMPGADK